MMSSIELHVCQYFVISFAYCMHVYIRLCIYKSWNLHARKRKG